MFIDILHFGLTVAIIVLQRWLLELSTFEKDWAWFMRSPVMYWYERSRWYRGYECIHQVRAWAILRISYA